MERDRRVVTPVVIHTSSDMHLLEQYGKRHFGEEAVLEQSPTSAKKKQNKRSTSKVDNTASTKKSQQEQPNGIYHPTMEPINEDSNGSLLDEFSIFSELNVLQNRPKQYQKRTSNSYRVDSIRGCLVKYVSIVSPVRVRCLDYAEDLLTYRFEKPKKSFSSYTQEKQMRSLHYTFSTLESLYREWRLDPGLRYFYLICGKHTLHLTRHHKCDSVPMMLLHSDNDNIEKTLKQEYLRYHSHSENPLSYLFSLFGNNIGLFYKQYTMELLRRELPFEAIANFKFAGCSEYPPRYTFNGAENRQFYSYLLEGLRKETVVGLFGEKIEKKQELFLCKFYGYFLYENLNKFLGRLELLCCNKKFYLYCEPVKYHEQFPSILHGPLPCLSDGKNPPKYTD